jgi:hypothetical protein
MEPRGTVDVDMNVFVDESRADDVLAALPPDIKCSAADRALLIRDGQVRLRWGRTPIDLFLATHPFHHEAATAARMVPMGDRTLPVLSCRHLAVFKTMFARGKDFVDLADMVEANSFDVALTRSDIEKLLGSDAPELDEFDGAVDDGRDPDRDEPRNRFPRR